MELLTRPETLYIVNDAEPYIIQARTVCIASPENYQNLVGLPVHLHLAWAYTHAGYPLQKSWVSPSSKGW